jgi:hypothetical protein
MTLTTHAVFGATVASFFPGNPQGAVIAFCAAFASHFALDAIPHWDYPIRSASVDPEFGATMKYDKNLALDAVSIGSDALFGILLSAAFFSQFFLYLPFLSNSSFFRSLAPLHPSLSLLLMALLGACAAILPDALQFVYGHFKHEPLVSLQHFHTWIHTDIRFKDSKSLGILTQVLFLAVLIGCIILKNHY